MATIADSIQLTLEQKIVPTIFESLWKLDPVYPMIARSSTNVVRNQGLGRSFQVLKTWSTGVAGGAKFINANAGNVVTNPGTGPHNYTYYQTPQTFQGVDETTAPAFLQSTLSLIEHRGNFYLPHVIMRADRLNASIGSVIAVHLKGVADLLAQQEAAMFYSTDSVSLALGTIDDCSDAAADHADDDDSIVFDLSDDTDWTGRIHRFRQGMMVDIHASGAAGAKRNVDFYLIVDQVDPILQTITIRRADGATWQIANVGDGTSYVGTDGDGDVIVIKDSYGVAPNGLESWIKTSGTFFGIEVADFPQFKSHVPSDISAALDEMILNRHIAFFYESFPGRDLDAAITTMGVLMGFLDNIENVAQQGMITSGSTDTTFDSRMRYDRNGKAMTVVAGWDSFKYRFASKPLEIYTSTLCNKGTFYAGKFKNGGITRYVPPSLPNTKIDARFGSEVEFVAPMGGTGGYNGIFKHAHSSSGQTTDFLEAPFVRQWNCIPTQPNFLRLNAITEAIG